jgi:hypothetical protein
MRAAALLLASVLALAPAVARADVSDQTSIVAGVMVGLGTAGALATSIAALVYAADGRAFDTPWIVAALFSAAFCVAAGIGVIAADYGGAPLIAPTYFALAAWPLGWSVRSAFAPAGFGEPLDAPAPPPTTHDALAIPALVIRF